MWSFMGPRSAISQASSRLLCALSGPVRLSSRLLEQPGAGQETAGKVVHPAGAAEAVHGVLEGCAARVE